MRRRHSDRSYLQADLVRFIAIQKSSRFSKRISECVIARPCSSPCYITYRRCLSRSNRISRSAGGTWLGISNVRTRQTKLITIIASTTFSIAPTPRAERS